MTDPVCHKARYDVDAFVTGAQQGESSSATSSSSGISCCETDDEGSSTDSDDDDDENDHSSSFGSNKKWATADGYDLTTFDQTECGTWAIDQPLPLPLWAKDSKSALVIDKVNNPKHTNEKLIKRSYHLLRSTHTKIW